MPRFATFNPRRVIVSLRHRPGQKPYDAGADGEPRPGKDLIGEKTIGTRSVDMAGEKRREMLVWTPYTREELQALEEEKKRRPALKELNLKEELTEREVFVLHPSSETECRELVPAAPTGTVGSVRSSGVGYVLSKALGDSYESSHLIHHPLLA